MLNEVQRACLRIHVNVTVHMEPDADHLKTIDRVRESEHKLGAIDVDHFLNPRGIPTEEGLHHRTHKQFIWRGNAVLPRFINVQNRTSGF